MLAMQCKSPDPMDACTITKLYTLLEAERWHCLVRGVKECEIPSPASIPQSWEFRDLTFPLRRDKDSYASLTPHTSPAPSINGLS